MATFAGAEPISASCVPLGARREVCEMSSETEALSDIRLSAKRLSRRAVLLRGTGFAITLAFGLRPAGSSSKALTGDRAGSPAHPNAWVSIGVDGQVTLISPASEMGQGVMTSIPLLIAEEMDADWSQVKVEQAPSDRAAYGNPARGGDEEPRPGSFSPPARRNCSASPVAS